MIESTYFTIALICLGCIVILSNFINFQSLVSNLVFRSKNKKVHNQENNFLEIVSLWYQLKNKCDESKLIIASNKLDEVFPLLNGVIEDEQIS